MHQTTVRFGSDLWAALEEESRAVGVSVAQYVREAALARLAYTAGRRGDPMPAVATEAEHHIPEGAEAGPEVEAPRSTVEAVAQGTREDSSDKLEGSSALWAQSRQARKRARELREQTQRNVRS
jgi:hypothetical protein